MSDGATIAHIETIPLTIPFGHDGPPAGFGGNIWTSAGYLLVKVTDSDGTVGYGEAFGYNAIPASEAALHRTVAPLALGRPCGDIGALMEALEKPLHIFGRSGPVVYALSGLEIALWDIAGKRAGLSLARLLGGGTRRRVPAYTSLLKAGERHALQTVCDGQRQAGFDAVKLHETDPAMALAARESLGPDVALMMDVNCAWDLTAACEAARRLRPAALTWLEEPVWPPEDLCALTRIANRVDDVPLAAGENAPNPAAFAALADTPGLTYLQPSVTKVGGISAFLRVAHLAASRGKRLAPHSPYFGPGLLATLQLASLLPAIRWIEYFAIRLERPIFGGAELPDGDGVMTVPDGPGLGLDPDPAVLREFRAG